MEAQLIRSREELFQLESEWAELHASISGAAPFQHPGWLLPWWDVFGSGELVTIAMRDQGNLAGLAPMFLHAWNGRRQVTLLGTGVSDRLGFLVRHNDRDELLHHVLQFLNEQSSRWDVCDWQDLEHEFVVPPIGSIQHRFEPQYPCAQASLAPDAQQFIDGLPHGLRRNLRRYREKLDAIGKVEFETDSSEPSICLALHQLFELHAARWNGRGEEGMFNGAATRFHRCAASKLARLDKVRCFRLLLDEKPIAVLYGFIDAAKFWSYQTGFDPGVSRFSPGSLILEYTMTQLIGEGVRCFDFLRGDEEYKRLWGAQSSHSVRLLLWHSMEPPAVS